MPNTDFELNDLGSIVVITPLTAAANTWTEEYILSDEIQLWCGGFVVEPRYVEDIIRGITASGLTVS
jgi:hypothetical protein